MLHIGEWQRQYPGNDSYCFSQDGSSGGVDSCDHLTIVAGNFFFLIDIPSKVRSKRRALLTWLQYQENAAAAQAGFPTEPDTCW